MLSLSTAATTTARSCRPTSLDWDIYARGYEVADIPADKLNTIQYAFGKPMVDPVTNAVSCAAVDPWADYERTPTKDVDPTITTPQAGRQLLPAAQAQAGAGGQG